MRKLSTLSLFKKQRRLHLYTNHRWQSIHKHSQVVTVTEIETVVKANIASIKTHKIINILSVLFWFVNDRYMDNMASTRIAGVHSGQPRRGWVGWTARLNCRHGVGMWGALVEVGLLVAYVKFLFLLGISCPWMVGISCPWMVQEGRVVSVNGGDVV